MKEMKRILSLFLCLVMLVGYIPVGALAAEGDAATDPTEGTVIETTVPETTVPATTVPETTVPETTVPETTVPETTVPETTVPETTVPETTEETVPETTPVRKPVVIGSLGMTVSKKEAAGEVKVASRASDSMQTAAIFFGDVCEANADLTGGAKTMGTILSVIGGNGVSYETVGLVGDTYAGIAGTMADMTAAVRKALGQESEVYYAWGSQDAESDIADDSALLYSGDHYYIYHISEADMGAAADADAVSAQIAAFRTAVESMDKTSVLFIMSNAPLHAGVDNAYAGQWYTAVAEAAEKMDVVFFWSGNADEENYYVAKDGSETLTLQDGTVVTPNFTYMNAGYIDGEGQRKGVVTTVELFEDTIVFQDYSATGEYKDETCAHNVTVEREFEVEPAPTEPEETTAPSEPEGPALVELKVTYSKETLLSEELALSVAAVYDDGTTKELTNEEYLVGTLNADVSAQTYIISYGEQSHAFIIGKDAATDVAVVADEMEALTVTDVTNDEAVIAAVADTFTGAFAAYDITPDKYNTENSPAVVSMPAPEGSNAVYYWNQETNELEPVEDVVFENGKVVFTTDHFSAYTVGYKDNKTETEITVEDPQNATGSGNVVTTEKKTVYVLVDSITAGGEYLISNANSVTDEAHLLTATSSGVTDTPNVTVKTGKNESGNDVIYIESAATAATWTATARGYGYRLQSGNGRYLRHQSSLTSAGDSDDATTWYSGTNTIYRTGNGNRQYYLQYYSGWTASESSSNVYIYQKQTVTFATTTAVDGTYSIEGKGVSVVAGDGTTADLSAVLTFTPESGDAIPQDVSETATFAEVTEQNGDPNNVITSISGNTVTFSGNLGKALVKVSYDTNGDAEGGVVTNYVIVEAVDPYYTIDITENGVSVTDVIAKKSVTAGMTLQLGAELKHFTVTAPNGEVVQNPTLLWSSNNAAVATVDETGKVTFTGNIGTAHISVYYYLGTGEGAEFVYDTITITAHTDDYYTPSDGVTNFPEYPYPGSVSLNKTATAIGNFNETGIAQVELSMVGIPTTTGAQADITIMLDQSTSMDDSTDIVATQNATIAMLQSLLFDKGATEYTEATFNETHGHRIYIGYYNSTGVNSITDITTDEVYVDETNSLGFQLIGSFAEYETLCATLKDKYDGSPSQTGTEWFYSLKKCYDILNAADNAEGYDRAQYCVFMSDGAPTTYAESETSSTQPNSNSWVSNNARYTANYKYEYWSGLMKANNVTVYTVLLNESGVLPKFLMNDISGPGKEAAHDTGSTMSKMADDLDNIEDSDYAFPVATAQAEKMKNVFAAIGSRMVLAATDVKVEDLISDHYELIFDLPTVTEKDGTTPVLDQSGADTAGYTEFFIEILEYKLDANHNRIWDDEAQSYEYTSKIKIYMGEDGAYYYDGDTKIDSDYDPDTGTGVTTVFDEETGELVSITCAYFTYDAGTKKFVWNTDALNPDSEIALRYFAYLSNSLENMYDNIDGNEVAAETYPTNTSAWMTYTNHLENKCVQYFPEPQLTWSGAQVSYVFYLVNKDGLPINKSGQKVDFANATYVTQVFKHPVIWNDADGVYSLEIETAAVDKFPEEYKLYDENAAYDIHVYRYADEEDGADLFGTNYFRIIGDKAINGTDDTSTDTDYTTKVFNLKNGVKYDAPGYYSAKGGKITYVDKDGIHTVTETSTAVYQGFDFADTTVAFAVYWEPKTQSDTVVVDYGLDVLIDVTENDYFDNNVNGISMKVPTVSGEAAPTINESVYTTGAFTSKEIEATNYIISVEDASDIRFQQKNMEFTEPVEFFYDTVVTYYEGSNAKTGYMYSSVTVIPATTIYYEDSFVKYTNSGSPVTEGEVTYGVWTVAGETESDATQDQDRPGESKISYDLDADNVYGHDGTYSSMETYSLGSAMKVSVKQGVSAMASFDFYGTGFDVISLTDSTTGTIVVRVYDEAGTMLYNAAVDTYYGYSYENGEWVPTDNGTLYQVPVIKVTGLTYGQKYKAQIVATYGSALDHEEDSTSYDFYLDAIRIYDPTGNENDIANEAYTKDGEAYPIYEELRNNVINASDFELGETNGMVFVDGIGDTVELADYIGYGPNNELYLSPGQMVVFALDLTGYGAEVAKVQLGAKSADGSTVNYAIVDAEKITSAADLVNAATRKLETATDMFYDITDLKDKNIVIYNNGDGILSLTDIKVTFKTEPTNVDNDLFYTNVATIMNIMKNLQIAVPDDPNSDLEVTVELPESVRVGNTFDVKITAPLADSVTVNGVAAGTTIDDGVWLATLKAEEVGTMEINIVAVDMSDDGTEVEARAEVKAEVRVYADTYKPSFEFAPATAPSNSWANVTVTTDEDVAAVRIAGTLVTSYTVNDEGKRVWSTLTKITAESGEQQEVEVVAYSIGGEEYEQMCYITATPAARTIAQSVKNAVSNIAKTLMSWFKK